MRRAGTDWAAMYRELHDKYDALVKELLTMKREGFSPAQQWDAPKSEPIPQEIVAAINQVAFDSVTRRSLYEKAASDSRAGVPIEETAQRILSGEELPS